METNDENLDLGHLSLEIKPGDLIVLGDSQVQLLIIEQKYNGAIRLKLIAPKSIILKYTPQKKYNESFV